MTRNLTDRDREVLRLLERFRVLTTPQVARLLFGSHKRASARLLEMHDVNLLDRFRPYREDWGSHPWHWVLGPLGAGVLAAEKGEHAEKATRRWRGERTLAYANGQRLAHLVGVNDLFVSLSAHARVHAGASVVDWMTEAEATKWADGFVRPDAFGEWEEDGRRVEVFFEYDPGHRVAAPARRQAGRLRALRGRAAGLGLGAVRLHVRTPGAQRPRRAGRGDGAGRHGRARRRGRAAGGRVAPSRRDAAPDAPGRAGRRAEAPRDTRPGRAWAARLALREDA